MVDSVANASRSGDDRLSEVYELILPAPWVFTASPWERDTRRPRWFLSNPRWASRG